MQVGVETENDKLLKIADRRESGSGSNLFLVVDFNWNRKCKWILSSESEEWLRMLIKLFMDDWQLINL